MQNQRRSMPKVHLPVLVQEEEMGKETMGKGSARLHYGCGLQSRQGGIQLFAPGVERSCKFCSA